MDLIPYKPCRNRFTMEDRADPFVSLVEIDYLSDMFNLEVDNEKGKPVVITLREKPEHFEARCRA